MQFEGTKLVLKNQIRPMRIQSTVPAVTAILTYCQRHVAEGKIVRKNSETTPQKTDAWSMPLDDCSNILGKVTWQPSTSSWAAYTKTADGKKVVEKFKVGGLPRGLASQGVDAKDHFKMMRREKYEEAIEHWNTTDHSTSDRLIIPPRSSSD